MLHGTITRLNHCREELDRQFLGAGCPHVRDRLRLRVEPRIDSDSIARICGVEDEEARALLSALQSRPERLAALMLLPLVLVAWSQRTPGAPERGAVLDAAEAAGIRRGTPAFNLLGRWLVREPEPKLLDAWTTYVSALCAELGARDRERLADRILAPARRIVAASGTGFGFRLTSRGRELGILGRLAGAFESVPESL